ncbi:hypothetical protein HPG69_007818 [Diceros bicornis minor]|uniref:Uncharacterized protein n=1 Tax=Diceros bicornis minor TaxID=77932 RepID=A0A7J7EBP2_DICBM|nr:hypothetical protein HPG69_007818 [Diceros bicornis minor]
MRVLMLLEQMRRIPALSCLKDRNNFGFSQEVFDGSQFQKAQAVSVEVEVEETPLMNADSTLAVRRYFQRNTLYLQEKKYSPCTWETVRAEIMRSFSSSTNLQERLRRTWTCSEEDLMLLRRTRRISLLSSLKDISSAGRPGNLFGQAMGGEESALGTEGPTQAMKRHMHKGRSSENPETRVTGHPPQPDQQHLQDPQYPYPFPS